MSGCLHDVKKRRPVAYRDLGVVKIVVPGKRFRRGKFSADDVVVHHKPGDVVSGLIGITGKFAAIRPKS